MTSLFRIMARLSLKTILPLCVSLLLSIGVAGCGGLFSPSEKTAYRLSGVEDDSGLDDYLHKILADRLETALKQNGDEEEYARRVAYREQMIRADLVKALQAKGYYDGTVHYEGDSATPLSGTYTINTGKIYTIAAIEIDPPAFAGLLPENTIHAGDVLDAGAVLAAQRGLSHNIQKDHCYFALKVKNGVVLDKGNHTAHIYYTVDAAAEGHFGQLTFSGDSRVKISYLDRLVPWKEGECYRQEKIEKFQTTLLESGLFSKADIVLPDAPEVDGAVPVHIILQDRARRSLRAGASYYTDEGVGLVFGWENRNVFGAAEKLTTRLNLSKLKQSLEADLLKPYFLRQDQTLSLHTALRRQDTDAYEETGIDIAGRINRKLGRHLTGSSGVKASLTRISEDNNIQDDTNLYGLISLPQSLRFDNRDNALNATRGWLLNASLTPFIDVLGESDPFTKLQLGASTYLPFEDRHYYVLALRAAYGSILGAGRFDIPPTERFYAGGGGSVRGYGYQEVGPKDSAGEPLGGRSMVTGSVEMRLRFNQTIGAVAFVDAGSVSEESYAKMDNLAVGAGVGLRYYTGFGPLRFDIAVPLTEKKDIDRHYQFYISIGQAF